MTIRGYFILLQDRRQEREHQALLADFRAWRVYQACRGIAQGLANKPLEEPAPADIFPSLRALQFESDAATDEDDESLALQSFEHLRRSFGA